MHFPAQLRETFLKNEPMRSREETYAAVRKALSQLDDPFTRFLGPQQYQVLRLSACMEQLRVSARSGAWERQRWGEGLQCSCQASHLQHVFV